MELPAHAYRAAIQEHLEKNRVLIITGETGSGKTTVIPTNLFKDGWSARGKIGVTEPRRLAAVSTATFVASQLEVEVGTKVGYQVRFEDQTAKSTKVKFMTEGILLREIQADPDLQEYSVIMVDEAHERSQNTDLLLGLLKNLLTRRNDLQLIIASATINPEKFSTYFDNAPIVRIESRIFPVEIVWSEQDASLLGVCRQVLDIHQKETPGDILVFLPGESEINEVMKELDGHQIPDLISIPVHGGLSLDQQAKIFQQYPGKRKVALATNIAETSITIDGVAYVVDWGFVKQTHFHPEQGIRSLDLVPHSQAGCKQRTGRAGRTRPGKCFRMYTKQSFASRPQYTHPEIYRTGLANLVLAMEDLGISDVMNFPFIDPPDPAAFQEAYETLLALGAIDQRGAGLTELGQAMAKLPLDARIARMVLEAKRYHCVEEVATIAAFLSVRNIFLRPKGEEEIADEAHERFQALESDGLTFLKVWKSFQALAGGSEQKINWTEVRHWCRSNFLSHRGLMDAANIRYQLLEILRQNKVEITSSNKDEVICKAVASGLAYNLLEHAHRNRYRGAVRDTGQVAIHPSSVLFKVSTPRWLVAAELMRTTKLYGRTCTEVRPEWLPDIVPLSFSFGESTLRSYDSATKTATTNTEIICNGLVVDEGTRTVSLNEARRIQEHSIRSVQKKGWVPLVFQRAPGSSLPVLTAEYLGRTVRSYGLMKEGVTYHCELGTSLDGYEVKKTLQIFELD